jgi:phage gpG-like protein
MTSTTHTSDQVLDGSAELESVLMSFADQLENDPFDDAITESKVPIAEGFVEIFAMQQDSRGGVWPEHSPVTVKIHGEHPLLILTGDMYSSLTREGGDYNVMNVGDRSLSWGTSVTYAVKQNFGGLNENGSYTPAREFMWWSETMKSEVSRLIFDYIEFNIVANL